MIYLSFKGVNDKYERKDEATSSVKRKEIHSEISIPFGIYMRDEAYTTKSGIVIIHPTEGTQWVMLVDDFYFDPSGCPPPVIVLYLIIRGIY